jgi:hypothetical protein
MHMHAAELSAPIESNEATSMPNALRAASFAAAAALTLTLVTLTSTAHVPAVEHAAGHSLVSASGIGWDVAAAPQAPGIGWD